MSVLLFGTFLVAFVGTFALLPLIIPRLKAAGRVGKDVNKEGHPELAEIGGLSIVFGFALAIAFFVFVAPAGLYSGLIAGALTAILASFIGLIDDLFSIRHSVKTVLPVIAAIPIALFAISSPEFLVPFVGIVSLPIIYPLVLVPLGVTVMANLTNMFAGFNGMEAGLGIIISFGLLPLGIWSGSLASIALLLALSGALIAFMCFNKHPARVFMGDVGTLMIGATIACAGILGHFEIALVVVMIPYIVDFVIKAKNGFPTTGWWGTPKGGKLTCPGKPVGLAQIMIKKFGPISEKRLVEYFGLMEIPFVLLAILLYAPF